MITANDVRAAAKRLRGVVHQTPVLRSRTLDQAVGGEVFLKAECLQRGGSFKIRGAYNKISSLSSVQLEAGVAAFSSGNHAQAVALAAGLLGSTAVILMPEDTPASKLEATLRYGAEVVTYDRWTEDREVLGAALAAERGRTLVPPYDDPLVMAGQGTAVLELKAEIRELDLLVVPVGGGGLISGCATAAKVIWPGVRMVGVEPSEGDDTRRSIKAGERVTIPVPKTIADGLMSAVPGALTFPVIQERVDEIVTVDDDAIVNAMRFLFERLKVVVEPSGAVGVAALMTGALDVAGKRVGVVLSGGNVSAERFADLLRG